VWGGWLSKKAFQKEFAMHRLTFDPGQRRVLLLVYYIIIDFFSLALFRGMHFLPILKLKILIILAAYFIFLP
jgi:hypothetical protein